MFNLIQKITFALGLGVVSCAYAAENAYIGAPSAQSNPMTLSDALVVSQPFANNPSAAQVTITPGGVIHFLKVYFYSDTSCSDGGLLGVASIVDNNSGFAFSSGQTISLNPATAYALAANQAVNFPSSKTANNVQCIKLYLDGGNDTPNGVACQSFVETCGSGSCATTTSASSVSWVANAAACAATSGGTARYAYISGNGSNNIYKCAINTSAPLGGLTCSMTPYSDFLRPQGIAFNNGYAYITNSSTTGTYKNTIRYCTVSSTDGSLNGCAQTATSGTFTNPLGIAISAGKAFIVNAGDATLIVCNVSSTDGTLSDCTSSLTPTGFGTFSTPQGIAINNGYIYVANNATGSYISLCTYDSSGPTLACSQTADGYGANARGIAINNGSAYIVNANTNTVIKCGINPANGTLTSCAAVTVGTTSTTGAKFIAASNNGYLYVTNTNTTTPVVKCDLAQSLTTGCVDSNSALGVSTLAIGIY